MPFYAVLVHQVQVLLSGFLSTLARARAVAFGYWFVGSTPTGDFHSLVTARAGRTIGIGGHEPPSHTTGHAGPHPAVRSSMTKLVLFQKTHYSDPSPVGVIQCLMHRTAILDIRHVPKLVPPATFRPVFTDPTRFSLGSGIGFAWRFPLFPRHLPHPSSHPFRPDVSYALSAICQGIVVHPAD